MSGIAAGGGADPVSRRGDGQGEHFQDPASAADRIFLGGAHRPVRFHSGKTVDVCV